MTTSFVIRQPAPHPAAAALCAVRRTRSLLRGTIPLDTVMYSREPLFMTTTAMPPGVYRPPDRRQDVHHFPTQQQNQLRHPEFNPGYRYTEPTPSRTMVGGGSMHRDEERLQALPTLSTVLNGSRMSPPWPTRELPVTPLTEADVTPYCARGRPVPSPITSLPPPRTSDISPWMRAAEDMERGLVISPVSLSRKNDPVPVTSCSSPSESSTASATDPTESPNTKPQKTSRYLREMDRRAILERLARGEKQATLAKEYNVSRAAICNLFKHRHEVLSRTDEDPFAKHPKKRKNKKLLRSKRPRANRLAAASPRGLSVINPQPSPSKVHQVQSDSVLLLLTTMSDLRSSDKDFRRACERVMWLLMEEALSIVPIRLKRVQVDPSSKIMGVATEHPSCAISMEQVTCPMMEVFQLLEPEQPTGYFHVRQNGGEVRYDLADSHLPSTLKYHNVFLFDVAVISNDSVRAMIEGIKDRGALEVMIYVVTLFIASDVVEMLQREYPMIRIITTRIDSDALETSEPRRSCAEAVLSRFDQVYNTQYTMV